MINYIFKINHFQHSSILGLYSNKCLYQSVNYLKMYSHLNITFFTNFINHIFLDDSSHNGGGLHIICSKMILLRKIFAQTRKKTHFCKINIFSASH